MNPQPKKSNIAAYTTLIIFVLGIVYHAICIQFTQQVHADEIQKLDERCEAQEKALAEIPVIKEKINNIEKSQSEMHKEQKMMTRLLNRIEAKLE